MAPPATQAIDGAVTPDDVNLGALVRAHWQGIVSEAFASGRLKPLVLPYCLFGVYILPILWLTIPHVHRPWLYRSRWALMAFICIFSAAMIPHRTSANPAFAYAVGLVAAWGVLANLNLLVWTRPQWEAARIVKRRSSSMAAPARELPDATRSNVHSNPTESASRPRRRKIDVMTPPPLHAEDCVATEQPRGQAQAQTETPAYDYVWQAFPADGPFLTRLNWVSDLVLNFRCGGWNTAISSVPRPRIEGGQVQDGDLVDMASIPIISKGGYRRCLTEAAFVRRRLSRFVVAYLLLDFLSVVMMKDPFFILGPDHKELHNYALPLPLRGLPTPALSALRQLLSLAGVVGAIVAVFSVADLAQYYLGRGLFPSWGELWAHTDSYGSVLEILDRGLAGWWGSWWHQTFRLQFSAPAKYLQRHGHLPQRRSITGALVTLLVSFGQSGLLHSCGSVSAMPPTKPWRAPVFFLSQAVGILVQAGLSAALARCMPARLPRPTRRVTNLAFTLAWLYVTAPVFVNDLASTGLWLLEPVPVSPLRFFGFGHPTDHWLRWTRDYYPTWFADSAWWRSGLAM
ncbi:hypothetical protein B0I35DRAFT_404027 [Stachybotrys elegans]|uniref:Wax synthase domain-containing protein n=1 Tax=Stachybotrys elegans TaxID=80388 RepID=A0A8K0T1C3_9HYPO|nr:hypothetical protein B0I35DRAFT_404027 [Stachybotrys elegans]